MSAFRRYLVLQLPGTALILLIVALLHEAWGLSIPVAALIVAAWVVKDMLLFPIVRSAYEPDPRTAVERLIGERGRTTQELAPAGYVRVKGELWRAEASDGAAIAPGRPIVVAAVKGSTLLVSDGADRGDRA